MPPDGYADEIDRLEARSANDPRTHTFARLADLYRKAGELERALEVIESGLRHHPHYLNARIVHARLLRELGRPGDAISAFERVLQIDSQNLVAQAALSELREGEGEEPVTGAAAAPPVVDAGDSGERAPDRPRPPASGWLARLEEDWHSGRSDATPDSDGAAEAEADRSPLDDSADGEGASDPDEPGEGDEAAAEIDQARSAATDEAPAARRRVSPGASGDLETATLAELYARQGLFDEAIAIFERLLARDPYNARLAAALEEARRRERGKGGGSTNGGGREDATDSGAATHAGPRPDRRRGEPRVERGSDRPDLSAVAPPPAAHAPADAESIRAFLARLLEGRFAPPGGEEGGGDVGLDEWLQARGA